MPSASKVLLVKVVVEPALIGVSSFMVTLLESASLSKASITPAPEPVPSNIKTLVLPFGIVTVLPEPCLIVIDCDPEVPFSITIILETEVGAMVKVRVADKELEEVTLTYMALYLSLAPSAIVAVTFASEPKVASVWYENASAIIDKLRLVVSPQVPLPSPVAISFNLKSLSYVLAI